LRFFSIHFEYHILPHICLSPGFILFANHAPLLAHFQQNRLPMNLEASWTSNLISLTLNPASNLKLSILLETCSRMRSLQTLRLIFGFGRKGPFPEDSLHYVIIPSLSTLVVECPFDVSLALLDHIKPAPGCSLRLSTNLTNIQSITSTDLVAAQRIIAKFTNNYFCHRSATSFRLSFDSNFIKVEDIEGFMVSIQSVTTVPVSLFPLLLGTFEPAHTSGVKTLWVTTNALIHIINLHNGDGQRRPFPQIKTLTWQPDSFPDCTSLIVNFLASRRRLGMPIEIFDLTEWYPTFSHIPMDTKMLEEIPGLKVIWRDDEGEDTLREYICGSGRPQVLPGNPS